MALLDELGLFSDEQVITVDARSTNIIDLGVAKDIGPGNPVHILIQVVEAFDNLTNLKVGLETDDNEAFASATELASETRLLADIDAIGDKFNILYWPTGNERYISLYYDVTGTEPTVGKITASIVDGHQTNGPNL